MNIVLAVLVDSFTSAQVITDKQKSVQRKNQCLREVLKEENGTKNIHDLIKGRKCLTDGTVLLLQRAMHQEQLEARKRRHLFAPQQNPLARLVERWRHAPSPQVSSNFIFLDSLLLGF